MQAYIRRQTAEGFGRNGSSTRDNKNWQWGVNFYSNMLQTKHFPCIFHQENAVDKVEMIVLFRTLTLTLTPPQTHQDWCSPKNHPKHAKTDAAQKTTPNTPRLMQPKKIRLKTNRGI
jgi:hypothetical protein